MFTYVYLGLFQNVPNIFASNPGPGDPGFRLTVSRPFRWSHRIRQTLLIDMTMIKWLLYVTNVNPGLINHVLLIYMWYSSNSHNLILKWYPPN